VALVNVGRFVVCSGLLVSFLHLVLLVPLSGQPEMSCAHASQRDGVSATKTEERKGGLNGNEWTPPQAGHCIETPQ